MTFQLITYLESIDKCATILEQDILNEEVEIAIIGYISKRNSSDKKGFDRVLKSSVKLVG